MTASSSRHVLPAHPRAAGIARAYLRSECAGKPALLLDAALLLTTELVANALRHGLPDVAVLIDCSGDRLYVEVEDAGALLPEPRRSELLRESGRGLMLVDAFATDWGVRRLATGKTVWFTMSRSAPATPE